MSGWVQLCWFGKDAPIDDIRHRLRGCVFWSDIEGRHLGITTRDGVDYLAEVQTDGCSCRPQSEWVILQPLEDDDARQIWRMAATWCYMGHVGKETR